MLDVQAFPARQIRDALSQLGGAAAGVGAPQVDVALFHGPQRCPALRALGRHHEGAGLAFDAQVHDRPEDLGDDVTGLADHDRVPDEDVLGLDDLLVVQRGELDLRARHRDRLDLGVRRDPAGAADAHLDVDELGVDLFWRVLVGDGPAGCARRRAETSLQTDLVELDDHAVDLVRHRVTVFAVVGDELPYAVEVVDHPVVLGGGQTPGLEEVVGLGEAGETAVEALQGADAVDDHVEGQGGRDLGVLLAQ